MGKSVHGIRQLGAVLEALFVTFLWSTSYVLMKLGLKDIPPLTFAGLRYSLAFLCLLPLVLRPATRQALPSMSRTAWLGLIGLGMLAAASSAILGRRINRAGDIQPLIVTTVSMGVGSLVLLVIGLTFQGLPRLTLVHWALIGWLAVVNTAVAFTLWNHSLRTLSAIQSSLINNTMLAQIAILAWLFLGEPLTGQKITAMVLAGVGALLAQLRLGQVRVEARMEHS